MIELDNDVDVKFTMFLNERAGKPLKVADTSFSNLLTFISKPHIGKKNSNYAFVGGEVKEWRNNENTVDRTIITIDIDDMPSDIDLFSHVSQNFYYTFGIYSTHNHTPEKPRYRLLIPLDKAYDLSPEAYRAVVKHVCTELLDIDFYDHASEVLCQLMYFPTSENPETYEMHYQDEGIFKLSDILGEIEIIPAAQIPAKSNQYWVNVLQGLHEGEGKGRDSTAASLLGHLLRKYVDPFVAYELMVCWNERNTPPLEERDLQKIYKSILSSEMQRRGGG